MHLRQNKTPLNMIFKEPNKRPKDDDTLVSLIGFWLLGQHVPAWPRRLFQEILSSVLACKRNFKIN